MRVGKCLYEKNKASIPPKRRLSVDSCWHNAFFAADCQGHHWTAGKESKTIGAGALNYTGIYRRPLA
jgi:hypothetical protein